MKPEHRAVPAAPIAPIAPIAGHVPPRAKKLASLLHLGVPGALAGFACLAGAQQAAPAAAEAVTLNPDAAGRRCL